MSLEQAMKLVGLEQSECCSARLRAEQVPHILWDMSPGTLLSILAPSPLPHRMREFREPPQDNRHEVPQDGRPRVPPSAAFQKLPKLHEQAIQRRPRGRFPAEVSGRCCSKGTHLRAVRLQTTQRDGRKAPPAVVFNLAACGSARRRAYPRLWSCGRVAEGGGLLNRYRLVKAYRGFESLRLRQSH